MLMKKIILSILLLTTCKTIQANPEDLLPFIKETISISNHPQKCLLYNIAITYSINEANLSGKEQRFLLDFIDIFNNTNWRGEENIKILSEEEKKQIIFLKKELNNSYENIHIILNKFLETNTI